MSRPFDRGFLSPWHFERGETAAVPAPATARPASSEADKRAVDELREVRKRHEGELLRIDGVEGLGETHTPRPALLVYCREGRVASRIPRQLEGVEVRTVVTGPFVAQNSNEI
jgi:hypothetical protein